MWAVEHHHFIMKVFLYKLILFTACVSAVLFIWNTYSLPAFHDNISWFILLFFAGTTTLVHFLLIRSAEKNPKAFVNQFMGLTAMKLFVYLSFLILVFLVDRDHARSVALYFLVMYLLFTVFEVSSLYNKLKK
jgi:hypothetical protein